MQPYLLADVKKQTGITITRLSTDKILGLQMYKIATGLQGHMHS